MIKDVISGGIVRARTVLVEESVAFALKTLTRSKAIPPATQAIQNISQVPHDRMNVNTTHR